MNRLARSPLPCVAAVLCLAATTLAALQAPSAGAGSTTTAETGEPLLVELALPDAATGAGYLTGYALPSRAATKHKPRAAAWTVPGDAFSVEGEAVVVRLDPRRVPRRFVEPGGLVSFSWDYTNPKSRTVGAVSGTMRAVNVDGTPAWVDPHRDLPSLRSNARRLLPAVAAADLPAEVMSRSADGVRVAETGPAATLAMVPGKRPRSAPAVAGSFNLAKGAAATRDPIGGVPKCKWTGKRSKRWATIGTAYPLKSSTGWLTYTSSTNSSFGAAVSWNHGVSFKAAGTHSLGDDWGQNFKPRNVNRSFRVQTLYEVFKCSQNGEELTRSWKPRWETGGTWGYKLSSAPKHFKTCAPIAAGTWFRGSTRGKDYTWGLGVKFKGVIGIDLETRRSYTNGARLYYDNDRRRRACGNNDHPARASKIRERPRRR